jgi:hypothetical protein
MREAGFEPANPKDVGLSDAALTTNRFAPTYTYYRLNYYIFGLFLFHWTGSRTFIPPPISYRGFLFKLFSTRNPYNYSSPSLRVSSSSSSSLAHTTLVSSAANKAERHIGQVIEVSHHVRRHFTQNKCPHIVKT